MIHILEISPKLEIEQLKKLSRRYAMTGGYELSLEQGLSADDLELLFERYSVELKKYTPGTSAWYSNNAFRVLDLLRSDLKTSEKVRDKVNEFLNQYE